MATEEEIEALFPKKERKPRPPSFYLETPFGRLRAALNLSMSQMSHYLKVSATVLYRYENGQARTVPYDRILALYRYAQEHEIQLEESFIEELEMAYKEINRKKNDYPKDPRKPINRQGFRPSRVDDFTREPITPIQALRYRMEVKFLDWIHLIDLSYNQALMYERGGSVVPIDLGKRMQEIARRRGIAITLDELYQNVVPRGITKEGEILKWRDYIAQKD